MQPLDDSQSAASGEPTDADRLSITREALHILYDCDPILDDRHLLVDPHQMRSLIHEMAILLHDLSTQPMAAFLLDPIRVGAAQTLGLVAHYVSCEEQDETPHAEGEYTEWPQHPTNPR